MNKIDDSDSYACSSSSATCHANNFSYHNTISSNGRSHELPKLYGLICQLHNAKSPNSTESWLPLLQYLTDHPDPSLLRSNILQPHSSSRSLSTDGTTALHLTCKHSPPTNIIRSFLAVCPEAVRRADSLGRLPLHYACHHGCDAEVLGVLVDAYPGGCLEGDALGRTPLHFAVGDGSKEESFGAEIVELLVGNGAAGMKDHKQMLPLHYACAYGATPEVLQVLITAHPPSIIAKDSNNLTPLHYVCGNCERPASPLALDFLLSTNPDLVNFDSNDFNMDDVINDTTNSRSPSLANTSFKMSIIAAYLNQKSRSHHPLHALAHRASNFKPSNSGDLTHDQNLELSKRNDCARANAHRCLDLYLNHNPQSTPDFLTALQALPEWLRNRAVVHPTVKKLLNENMAHQIPTAVVMLDLYAHTAIIVTYFQLVIQSIDNRYDSPDDDASVSPAQLVPMYIGVMYFTLRFTLKILSFLSLHLLDALFQHGAMSTLMDVLYLALTYFWAIVLTSRGLGVEYFRWGAAFTLLFFWVILLKFLRNLLFDFAVFVNGVLHVLSELRTFLSVMCMMLMAFMQMFHTTFLCTGSCERNFHDDDSAVAMTTVNMNGTHVDEPVCPVPTEGEFCTLWEAFLAVFTMLLGEVDAEYFESSKVATFLFVIFVFLCVILLANVLIAIVTDSYGVIRNERAAMVFWSYRLAFVIQMDVICSGVWKKRVACLPCGAPTDDKDNRNDIDDAPLHTVANGTSFTSRSIASSPNGIHGVHGIHGMHNSFTSRTISSSVNNIHGISGVHNTSYNSKTTVSTTNTLSSHSSSCDMFSDLWIHLLEFLNDDSCKNNNARKDNDGDISGGGLLQSRWLITLLRIVTAVVIIPVWLALGLVTAGWVWPPQVREKILQHIDYGGGSGSDVGSEEITGGNIATNFGVSEPERRRIELERLRKDVEELKENFGMEMVRNREMIKEMRNDLVSARSELSSEVTDIKKIVLRLAGLHRARERQRLVKDKVCTDIFCDNDNALVAREGVTVASGTGSSTRSGSVGISSSYVGSSGRSGISGYSTLSTGANSASNIGKAVSISFVDIDVGEGMSVTASDTGTSARSGSVGIRNSNVGSRNISGGMELPIGDDGASGIGGDASVLVVEGVIVSAETSTRSGPTSANSRLRYVNESMTLSTRYGGASGIGGDASVSVDDIDKGEVMSASVSSTGPSTSTRSKSINISNARSNVVCEDKALSTGDDDASSIVVDASVSVVDIDEGEVMSASVSSTGPSTSTRSVDNSKSDIERERVNRNMTLFTGCAGTGGDSVSVVDIDEGEAVSVSAPNTGKFTRSASGGTSSSNAGSSIVSGGIASLSTGTNEVDVKVGVSVCVSDTGKCTRSGSIDISNSNAGSSGVITSLSNGAVSAVDADIDVKGGVSVSASDTGKSIGHDES